MRRLLFLYILSAFVYLYAGLSAINMLPDAQKNIYQNIKILDQKRLSYSKISGVTFAELSDLAYDKKTKVLYMLSDKGSLFAFEADFSSTIDKLVPLFGVKLRNKRGKRFKKWKRDSEGMTLDGRGHLVISFEGKAKIAWFHKNSKHAGNLIQKYKLPKILKKTNNYRSQNKSLEALAWHPKYGLLTATEWPLKQYHKKRQTIYAFSGKKWHFKAEPESRSAVVAMEVMDDGNILILERSYTDLFSPFIITLKKVYINRCKQGICQSRVLLKMNSHQGWKVDNFEGLAKVGKNRYVMISDDNENFFQKTLLIYFEVIDG